MTTTYSASELKVGEDWRYSEPQMKLRQEVLIILMKEFGNDNPYTDYPNRSIYECANEWVEKGHATTSGLVSYFKAYYNKQLINYRKMSCQKVVNVLAVASAAVSLAVVGTAGYVFVNKDAIIESVTEKALGGLTGGLGGGALPTGANDLAGPSPTQASTTDTGLGVQQF